MKREIMDSPAALERAAHGDHRKGFKHYVFGLWLLAYLALSQWAGVEGAVFDASSAKISNKYYPLNIGGKFTYRGTGSIGGLIGTHQATAIETVDGVNCIKVAVNSPDGNLYEWFAQDTSGAVWRLRQYDLSYHEYDEEDYLIMPANPQVGERYTIWFLEYEVGSTTAQITVPAGTFSGCLQLRCVDDAWPDEEEYYAPGVGEIKSFDSSGGYELTSVTGIKQPPTAPTITTSSPLPGSTAGMAYNQVLAARGGTTPYTWSIASGDLPSGLSLSKVGVISGTPSAASAASFTVRVTGNNGMSSTKVFDLRIDAGSAAPTLTITAPTPGLRVSNVVFTVTGTAHDNVAVSSVFVKLNDSGWMTAVGTTSWTADVTLVRGTNTIQAYAVNTSGNCSVTNSRSFTCVPRDRLTVAFTGPGTLSPNYSNAVLEIGKAYGMTAKPGTGYLLSNWMDKDGKVLTNGSAVQFTMRSNLVLVANIVPNPFGAAAGNYAGLFYDTNNGVTISSAGFVTASITSAGTFTARLQQGAASYALSGQFSVGSEWSTSAIKGAPGWGARLRLNPGDSDQLSGEISNGVWTAELVANRAAYSKANAASQAGQYTLVIPGRDDSASLPGGHGAAAVNVSSAGAVSISGILGDGTPVTQSTFLSKHGQWPLFATPYAKRGILIGWLTFTNDPVTANDLAGVIAWIKPGQTGTKLYPNGFNWPYDSGVDNAFGSAFVNRTPLLSWTNGVVILEGGNLTHSVTNGLVIGSTGKLTGTNKLSGTITTAGVKAGLFKASVMDPATKTPKTINGAILQNRDAAYGNFLGADQSGKAVILAR